MRKYPFKTLQNAQLFCEHQNPYVVAHLPLNLLAITTSPGDVEMGLVSPSDSIVKFHIEKLLVSIDGKITEINTPSSEYLYKRLSGGNCQMSYENATFSYIWQYNEQTGICKPAIAPNSPIFVLGWWGYVVRSNPNIQ